MTTASEFIHRFEPGQSARTLLLLHGTGGNETDLLDLGRALDEQAALLSPRGKVLENGMPRFFRRLAEGVFDEEDLKNRTHELAEFVIEAAKKHERDPARIVAVGFSNGANIAAAMMLLRPEVLAGAVLIRAMVPLEPDPPPDLSGKSALILSGKLDPIVPGDHPPRLAEMLQRAGADVTLKWIDTGHGLIMPDVLAGREWLGALINNN